MLRLERAVAAGHFEIELVSDDDVSVVDIPHFVTSRGGVVEHEARGQGGWRFRIRFPGPEDRPDAPLMARVPGSGEPRREHDAPSNE